MAKKKTKETRSVESLLKKHFPSFPRDYPPTAYRDDLNWIHVRIVDCSFEKIPRMERCDVVNPILRLLPEKTQLDIVHLYLFAPGEVKGSGLNAEFEHPSSTPRFEAHSRNGFKPVPIRKTRTRRGART